MGSECLTDPISGSAVNIPQNAPRGVSASKQRDVCRLTPNWVPHDGDGGRRLRNARTSEDIMLLYREIYSHDQRIVVATSCSGKNPLTFPPEQT